MRVPINAAGKSDAVGLIQARMSSTRLPGKVLRQHAGATVLSRVVRLTEAFARQAVVCTSTEASDDPIQAHCAGLGVVCVRGSLRDVFSRFRQALNNPSVERTPWFFRITADCPLLSTELARILLRAAGAGADYLCFDDAVLPRGISAELVRRAAFEAIDTSTLDAAEREHVTAGLRERFGVRALRVPIPPALAHPQLRLTLDYPEDERLLSALWSVDSNISAEQAVAYLLEHPEVSAINQGCQQKPVRGKQESIDAITRN
jgi:spore coat polysaccharide biosynthesis protein SpsF